MNLNKKIPFMEFPTIVELEEAYVDEPLVPLSDVFFVEPFYYNMGIKGALTECYVRKRVKDKLIEAKNYLPKGLTFKILDGYRPIEVQQYLWDLERNKIKSLFPEMSETEIDKRTSLYVSKPSYDISKPCIHNTGGAIDLTLVTESGYTLDMGTQFDDFSHVAWIDHFEDTDRYHDVRYNRRILYNAMIEAGFTNLPTEWWHYDYGDKFWSYFSGNPKLYQGILDMH